MILDIDAGNTRVKWALHKGDIYANPEYGQAPREQIRHALASFETVPIKRVRLASVVGECTDIVSAWGVQRSIDVEVAKVVDGTVGVICGYRQPERLGVDRWLALLAVRKFCPGAYVVADAGTALTLDLVDENNTHLGGYIAPGIQMMMASLGANTWGVNIGPHAGLRLLAGRSTTEAAGNGCLAAAMGMIEKIMADCRYDRLFLTGGDAEVLAEQFQTSAVKKAFRVEVSPHLVLAGLSVALP